MQYINNLWRVDPSSFAATLNMICMRAPALMQRLMDHEVNAANAAIGQYGNMKPSDAALGSSPAEPRKDLVPSQQLQQQQHPQQQQQQQQQQMSALQDPDELEVVNMHTPHHPLQTQLHAVSDQQSTHSLLLRNAFMTSFMKSSWMQS